MGLEEVLLVVDLEVLAAVLPAAVVQVEIGKILNNKKDKIIHLRRLSYLYLNMFKTFSVNKTAFI